MLLCKLDYDFQPITHNYLLFMGGFFGQNTFYISYEKQTSVRFSIVFLHVHLVLWKLVIQEYFHCFHCFNQPADQQDQDSRSEAADQQYLKYSPNVGGLLKVSSVSSLIAFPDPGCWAICETNIKTPVMKAVFMVKKWNGSSVNRKALAYLPF